MAKAHAAPILSGALAVLEIIQASGLPTAAPLPEVLERYLPLEFGQSLRLTELSPAVWCTSSW